MTFTGPEQTDDAQISADNPNANDGDSTLVNVDGATPHAHGVVKFLNVLGTGPGQVPLGSTIISATVRVNCSNKGNIMNVYRLTEDWVESEVTWNRRSSAAAWTNTGADGPVSHASVAVIGDCTATGQRTVDITQFAQEWSDGAPNYGIVLTDSGTDGIDFDSSESGNPPVLSVTHMAGSQTTQTRTLSGEANATITFDPVTLDDQQTYSWNVQVTDVDGMQNWAPYDFVLTVDSHVANPPVAVNDSYNVNEDGVLVADGVTVMGVLANDTDADNDPLTAVRVGNVSHGTLSLALDGTFTYIPNPNFNGTDSFSYVANDGIANSNVATVTITASPVNDEPTANSQSVTTAEDTPAPVTLTGSDPDGDPLTYAVLTAPTRGSLSGTAPNLTYTPNSNYNGADAFTFKINDGTADSEPATVSITVTAVNDPPTADGSP